jgi:hypothetical protein
MITNLRRYVYSIHSNYLQEIVEKDSMVRMAHTDNRYCLRIHIIADTPSRDTYALCDLDLNDNKTNISSE